MKLIQFIINKLAGYDVSSKRKELEKSISVLQEEKSQLTSLVRKEKAMLVTTEKDNSVLGNHESNCDDYQDYNTKTLESELNDLISITEKQRQRNVLLVNQLTAYQTIFSEAQKSKDELQIKYAKEISRLESALEDKDKENQSLQNQNSLVQTEKNELKRLVNDLNAMISQQSNELTENEELIAKLTQAKIELDNERVHAIQTSQQEKNLILKELEEKTELLAEKDTEIEQITATLSKYQDKSTQGQSSTDEMKELEYQIQMLQEQISDRQRETEILKSQLEQKEKEVKEIGQMLTGAHERINECQDKITSEGSIILNQKQEIQRLKEEILVLQQSVDKKTDLVQENTIVSATEKSLEVAAVNNSISSALSSEIELATEEIGEVAEEDAVSLAENEEAHELSQPDDVSNEVDLESQKNVCLNSEVGTQEIALGDSISSSQSSGSDLAAEDITEVISAEVRFWADDEEVNDFSLPNKESDDADLEFHRSTTIRSKEDEIIELSGTSMLDFPPIVNDSSNNVHRSIEFVFDGDGRKIYADDFFKESPEVIARKSRQLAEAAMMKRIDFVCGECHAPVKIAHRTINGRESLFFAHASRDVVCEWIPFSTPSKGRSKRIDESIIAVDQTIPQEEKAESRRRLMKQMIYSLLCTPESEKMGISDVKCNTIIRSIVPYMQWRRPDMTFKYKEKDIVIVLQSKNHDLQTIVDRDVFFRLNNYHVIWVFGLDDTASYDYIRGSNYKNTLFDCHRNIFVFDKEAQQSSEEKNTLCLKYNWLDENDNWAVSHSTMGSNGLIAEIADFVFDDEDCKPYIIEANEPYFSLHPKAKKLFLETRKTREQLLKELEDKWKGNPAYEEALRVMKLFKDRATLFQYMGLWGFRFNTTVLIQTIFTQYPVDLHNGFFMVKQGETAGVVNYFGEVIMDWTVLECDSLTVDVANNSVLFCRNDLWGVADFKGNVIIEPRFEAIKPWSSTTYRVRMSNLWGLHNQEDQMVITFLYDAIGELSSGKAEVELRDKDKSWIKYKGFIDVNGNAVDSNTRAVNDRYTAFERFEKWGVRTYLGQDVVLPTYEDVQPWTEHSVRVKDKDRWGVIGLPDGNIVIPICYDSIGKLEDGRAKVTRVGVTNIVDAVGNVQVEKSIKLQNGFIKSKKGNKWGIEKDGREVIPHKYDEIGAFRRRFIGVINSSIVKLNAYYDYPVRISGSCLSVSSSGVKVDISGVQCFIPKSIIEQVGFDGHINRGRIFDDIAFSNLIFSQKHYLLRFISDSQLLKKTSHGDKDSDFSINEIVTGTIVMVMKYQTEAGKVKMTKVKLRLSDGRETMVPKRFFVAAGLNMLDFRSGDILHVQKTGFDDELDQTIWSIISTSHVGS